MNRSILILDIQSLQLYREKPILKSISWKVFPQEHWAILGANGSGKTSLLNVLTGYLPPSSGKVSVLGKTYGEYDWRELRRKIGLVSSSLNAMIQPDEPIFDLVLSGKEAIVNYWGKPNPSDIEKTRQVLKQVECEEFADRAWSSLSQGEKQRALIGRALMAEPEILILDESCAGLDLVARDRFLNFLGRLVQKQPSPTLLFVTHHVEEIRPFLTHLLVLKEGQVLKGGAKSILTSELLSEAFEAPIQLEEKEGEWRARIHPDQSSKIV